MLRKRATRDDELCCSRVQQDRSADLSFCAVACRWFDALLAIQETNTTAFLMSLDYNKDLCLQ